MSAAVRRDAACAGNSAAARSSGTQARCRASSLRDSLARARLYEATRSRIAPAWSGSSAATSVPCAASATAPRTSSRRAVWMTLP